MKNPFVAILASLFADSKRYHEVLSPKGEGGMFMPRKHPIQSYAAQKRAAKKRRNIHKFNRKRR